MPTPQGVTMSSKSSVSQAASFVSQVMMSDSSLRSLGQPLGDQMLAHGLNHRVCSVVDAEL